MHFNTYLPTIVYFILFYLVSRVSGPYLIDSSFLLSLPRLQDEATPKSVSTPSRLRGIGNFLGNATPAHLRRLAGRMAARSPSLSIASSRRSKHSSSGSSNRSHSRSRSRKSRGSHRRQGTFPGTYSQRNSSEMDHQRPPADPVYTFMIKVTVPS